MPQLDKYIIFNLITYLTFFFTLIYFYVRGTVIPKLSTLLKYRKKKAYLFTTQIDGYIKVLNFSKTVFDKKGKTYTSFLLEKINKINEYYQIESTKQQINLYKKFFEKIKEQKKVVNSIMKTKLELKRLNILTK